MYRGLKKIVLQATPFLVGLKKKWLDKNDRIFFLKFFMTFAIRFLNGSSRAMQSALSIFFS